MLLETLLLGTLTVTSYRSVPEQTDNSPFITSIGHRTHPYGCAVSQDLLKSGRVKYGDYVCVDKMGCFVANDTMHPRHTNHIDIWVASYEEEKKIQTSRRKAVRVRGK